MAKKMTVRQIKSELKKRLQALAEQRNALSELLDEVSDQLDENCEVIENLEYCIDLLSGSV